MQASAGGGHQGHAMPSSASANERVGKDSDEILQKVN